MQNADRLVSAIERELSVRWPASERFYPAGVRLIAQGSPVDHIYLLISGVVKLSFVKQCGRESILSLRSAGCILGSESALLDAPSLVSVTTLTKCEARHYPAVEVRESLLSSATLSFNISRSIARESQFQTAFLMDASSGNARQRLISLLQKLGGTAGSPTGALSWPQIPLKKHELAEILGVTPEHLSRVLGTLQREGLIERGRQDAVSRGMRTHIQSSMS